MNEVSRGAERVLYDGTYGDLYWYADKTVVPKAVNHMEFAVPADPVGELTAAGFTDCAYYN